MSSPYDQNPQQPQQYGQPPQFGQAPQFGAPAPQQPQAPAWGQPGAQPQPTQPFDPNANPYATGDQYQQYPQAYGGVPMQTGKPVKQRGRGAAGFLAVLFGTIVGRVVIGLVVVGAIAAYHFATANPAQRNSNGQITQSGSLDATSLKVADCFDAPTGNSDITSIKAVPCTQPHDSQVFAEPAISESSYPGDSTLQTEAKNDCGSNSTQASISQSAPQSAQIADYYPQDATTFGTQRYVICALEDDSAKMTQSYVSSAG